MNMNPNHKTPPPAPQPFCAVYAPLLPLLRVDELDADQAAAVREHLADCAWCQAKLATHAVVGDALRRHFGSGHRAAPPTFTLETIMSASQQDTDTAETPPAPQIPPSPPRRSPGRRTAVAALAAVVLLAIFAGMLFAWMRAPREPAVPHPTPVPTLDAQTQAYVAVLRMYYPPFVRADGNEAGECAPAGHYGSAPAAQKPAIMQACRPLEEATLHAAQALLAHLQTADPPARWQAADTQLKQAAQGYIAFATERIRAIDAHDANRFVAAADNLAIPAATLFCAPLERITTDLRNAGVPPVDLQELQPNDVDVCLGVSPSP